MITKGYWKTKDENKNTIVIKKTGKIDITHIVRDFKCVNTFFADVYYFKSQFFNIAYFLTK